MLRLPNPAATVYRPSFSALLVMNVVVYTTAVTFIRLATLTNTSQGHCLPTVYKSPNTVHTYPIHRPTQDSRLTPDSFPSQSQNLFKDQGETDESNIPFVGAIVGPYFGADPVAEITWFHIDENGFGDESLLSIQTGFRGVPKGLRCEYTQMGDSFGDGGVDELTQIQTQKKLERLKSDAFELCDVFGTGAEKWDRTELSKKWGATGFERTRLEKLCVSLRSRLPGSTTNDEIVSSVAAKMKQSWK